MLGATKPLESAPGTIRGDFCLASNRNVCHASDSVESSTREVNLWFNKSELQNWTKQTYPSLYSAFRLEKLSKNFVCWRQKKLK